MRRQKGHVKVVKIRRFKRRDSMNINQFREHDVDESLEKKLDGLGKEPWFKGFINHVNSSYCEISQIPGTSPSIQTSECNESSDTKIRNRSLHWAITTAAQMLSTNELPKRMHVLSYVIEEAVGVQNLLCLLERTILSTPLNIQLSFLLRETVNSRNPAARVVAVQYLMDMDAMHKLLDLLVILNNEIENDKNQDVVLEHRMCTVNLVWILASIGAKESRFGVNLKTLGKAKFLHAVVRDNLYTLGGEVHQPFLRVLRIMCKSGPVGHILRSDKVFNTIKKLFEIYNYQPSLRFQTVLDILMILTKTATKPRLHSKKFLKSGLLIAIMRAFNYWPMWKGKGLLKLSKTTLAVYSNLTLTASGRKALLNTDALINVRRFCESCPNDKFFDDVVVRACAMIAAANLKHKLPFKDITSPAKFDIPEVPGLDNSKESGPSSDEDDPDEPEQPIPSDDDENSDVEQDTDEDEGRGDDPDEEEESEDDEIISRGLSNTLNTRCSARRATPVKSIGSMGDTLMGYETPVDKLAGFAQFFKELDGKLSDRANVFSDLMKPGDSVLADLLVGNLTKNDQHESAIPETEMKYSWPAERPEYGSGCSQQDLRKVYLAISRRLRSVIPFVKVAYPDIALAYNGKRNEPLIASGDRHTLRNKVLVLMGRAAGAETFKPRLIYDLDALINPPSPLIGPKKKPTIGSQIVNRTNASAPPLEELGNDDEKLVGRCDKRKQTLQFESRFESGNLRKVVQVGEREYDLYLTSDVNSAAHNQWFYFQISNIRENFVYTFNVVNCVKSNSQFNFGMQPVVFSVMDAMQGRPGWVRSGSQIVYHKNGFRNLISRKHKAYHSATFNITFQRRGDICYIAYHYPYTYTRLLTELWKIKEATDKKKAFVRYDVLCSSLNKNEVPLVTITGPSHPFHPVELREVIVLTARVHPGEPNASWVMHGILHKLLLGTNMEGILQKYIFKIVPMLNVEGVINGCHRCGLTNEDLNRQWKNPSPILHPSIYNTKALIEYSCKLRNKVPVLYLDFHGHSRRKNVFLYGCSRALSWWSVDRAKPEDPSIIQTFPEAMARRSPFFAMTYCNYDIRKARESTARVAIWREFGISRSYTLESSYCGCDRGPYKGMSIGINHLIEIGESVCESCEEFYAPQPAISPYLSSAFPPPPIAFTDTHTADNDNSENVSGSTEETRCSASEEDSSSDTESCEEEWDETFLN